MTESGRAHLFPASSSATPWVITVPAWPTKVRSAWELVGTARPMPLIFTLLDSPAPCAVFGENDRYAAMVAALASLIASASTPRNWPSCESFSR
ncbi:hypothetical protein D3C78_1651640 [compost metagenome]